MPFDQSDGAKSASTKVRIGVAVVAYNAVTTLAKVLRRIPEGFRQHIAEVIVSDDASHDDTYYLAVGCREEMRDLKITVIRNQTNLGYGGNQKVCYQLAKEHGLDIVVLLHGDGQYAPEAMPDLVAPLVEGRADAVFGSRMLERGQARRGGMPLYKFVGNRVLSTVQNRLLGTNLSEFHSGYRAYRVDVLDKLGYQSFSNDFDFDTEVIIALVDAGARIVEVPIPTYYGDEICYVNGFKYAGQVLQDSYRYWRSRSRKSPAQRYLASPESSSSKERYQLKIASNSSHQRIISRLEAMLAARGTLRVLDLGCGTGYIGAALGSLRAEVVGVDREVRGLTGDTQSWKFVQHDLTNGLPPNVGDGFDAVVLADVIEHLPDPGKILVELHEVLRRDGVLLVSVPNLFHWYGRWSVFIGRLPRHLRGIFDASHRHFFGRTGAEDLLVETGWRVFRREPIGAPVDLVPWMPDSLTRLYRLAELPGSLLFESLFAYQYLYEAVEG